MKPSRNVLSRPSNAATCGPEKRSQIRRNERRTEEGRGKREEGRLEACCVADWQSAHLPNTIRRNSRLPVCATCQRRCVSVAVPRCALAPSKGRGGIAGSPFARGSSWGGGRLKT